MNKLMLRLALILAITAGITGAQKFFLVDQFTNTQFPTQFDTSLNQEEQAVWHTLAQNGIQRTEFETKKIEYLRSMQPKQVMHAVSDDLVKILSAILQDFGISPDKISFAYMDERSEAATDADTIYINQTLFNQLPKETIKFVIGHEVQHLLFNDSIGRLILEQMLQNIDPQTRESLLNAYIHFQEIRADISVALKNEEYAQSYIQFINHIISMKNSVEHPSYPTDQQRLDLAHQTYNFLSKTNSGITV